MSITVINSKGNFNTGPHGLLLNHWTKTSPMWTITRPGVDEKLLNFISIISSKIQVYYLKKCCEIFFSYSNVKPHFLQDLLKQISSLVQNVSSLDQKWSRVNVTLDQNLSSVGQNMSRLDQNPSRLISILSKSRWKQ